MTTMQADQQCSHGYYYDLAGRAFDGCKDGDPDHKRGRTIREAIMCALEASATHPSEWSAPASDPLVVAVRAHVLTWVHDYAIHRGVILRDEDITSELEAVLATIRGKS